MAKLQTRWAPANENSEKKPLHQHKFFAWIGIISVSVAIITFAYFVYDRYYQKAPEALAKMGFQFDDDGFSTANSESNLEAIKLFLKGGKSPNEVYSGTFMLNLPLMRKSTKFSDVLKLYQNARPVELDFCTPVGPPQNSVMGLMTGANSTFNMADILFQELAHLNNEEQAYNENEKYSTDIAEILLKAGANPSHLLAVLRNDKAGMDEFLSDPRHRESDAMQQKMHELNTSDSLRATNQQLKFLEGVVSSSKSHPAECGKK